MLLFPLFTLLWFCLAAGSAEVTTAGSTTIKDSSTAPPSNNSDSYSNNNKETIEDNDTIQRGTINGTLSTVSTKHPSTTTSRPQPSPSDSSGVDVIDLGLLHGTNDPHFIDIGDSNDSSHHGNHSVHSTDHPTHSHEGIHVASWNFDYVKAPLVITLFITVAGFCKLGFHHADFLSSIVPESCLLIVLGTLVGVILYFARDDSVFPTRLPPDVFFLFLLPPIILESAYSLHDRVFFQNVGTVILYAVVGTVLNCFLLGPTIYGLSLVGALGEIDISFTECLLFSSLIVAVDPVAVLAIFAEIGVNNVLYILVFGESLLNDAVTVVLYNTMKSFLGIHEADVGQIFLAVAAFFTVSLGGLAIGVVLGILTAFGTKFTEHVRVMEPMTVFTLAYLSYLTAELFHFSGIISIIGCGLVQAQYAFQNISHKSYTTVKYFSKVLSTTSDCVIFMLLGITLVMSNHYWHTGFTLWVIVLCLIFRFIVVYFLSFIANRCNRLRVITLEEQFIMAYGGLRGAVCFSLVAMLEESSLPQTRNMFVTATLAVIIFTVVIQGITIKPLVNLLRITRQSDEAKTLHEEISIHVTDHVLAGIEEIVGTHGENWLREKINYIDNKYFKHWLQRVPHTSDEQIMELYQKIALKQHFESIEGTVAARMAVEEELQKLRASMMPGSVDMSCFRRRSTLHPPFDDHLSSDSEEDLETMVETPDLVANHLDREKFGHDYPDYDYPRRSSMPTSKRPPLSPLLSQMRRRFSTALTGRRGSNAAVPTTPLGPLPTAEPPPPPPTVQDLHKIFMKNPAQKIHQKSNKNMVRVESSDLLHQLHSKQQRVQRCNRSMSLAFGGGLVSPTSADNSPRDSPATQHRKAIEAIRGRYRARSGTMGNIDLPNGGFRRPSNDTLNMDSHETGTRHRSSTVPEKELRNGFSPRRGGSQHTARLAIPSTLQEVEDEEGSNSVGSKEDLHVRFAGERSRSRSSSLDIDDRRSRSRSRSLDQNGFAAGAKEFETIDIEKTDPKVDEKEKSKKATIFFIDDEKQNDKDDAGNADEDEDTRL
ncbi:Na(+)/H(+) exchanger beta isoform X2 [Lingula anatina]|uniref:Sodium/hydrogen exchanger n=1 Tax=Lingula anatina TaxID=7574 RepID=A0A1S3HDE0_LINAN|nr:Na(+)/H(+) exchanger beta isoform X2 [Lingula anatina]|eukprot:XP_013384035.1 Na(+)/H(+) exchanger beta isoform X2 [Lingula anatina]